MRILLNPGEFEVIDSERNFIKEIHATWLSTSDRDQKSVAVDLRRLYGLNIPPELKEGAKRRRRPKSNIAFELLYNDEDNNNNNSNEEEEHRSKVPRKRQQRQQSSLSNVPDADTVASK